MNPRVAEHGTESRYGNKFECRCDLCRQAASDAARRRRAKNPEANRRAQRKLKATRREIVLGGRSCERCGATERLELHHRDPSQKVTSSIWSWSWARLWAEFAKCDVLCHNCHFSHHIAVADARHGSPSRYNRGCRCEVCRQAAALRRRLSKARRLESAAEAARTRPLTKGQAN